MVFWFCALLLVISSLYYVLAPDAATDAAASADAAAGTDADAGAATDARAGTGGQALPVLWRLQLAFWVLLACFFLYAFWGGRAAGAVPFTLPVVQHGKALTLQQRLVRLQVLAFRHPLDGKIADALALAYLQEGDFPKAVNTYIDALQLNGVSEARLLGYGVALAKTGAGHLKKAQEVFEEAGKLAPLDIYPRLLVAFCLSQNQSSSAAAQYLQKFLQNNAFFCAPKENSNCLRLQQAIKEYQAQTKALAKHKL